MTQSPQMPPPSLILPLHRGQENGRQTQEISDGVKTDNTGQPVTYRAAGDTVYGRSD